MKKHYITTFLIFVLLIFLDLFTKHLAFKSFGSDGEITDYTILDKYLRLTYSENTGIAFGIPIPMPILIILSGLLLILMVYFLKKELNFKKPLAIYLITILLAGGVVNLFERAYRGYVVDFISVWNWPIFNLADTYILLGILLILIFYGKIKRV